MTNPKLAIMVIAFLFGAGILAAPGADAPVVHGQGCIGSYNPITGQVSSCSPTGPAAQSGSASITTDKTTYQIGDSIRICYTVPGPGPVTITDSQSGPVLSGTDDGTGGCLSASITPPTGQECETLTYSTSRGSGSTQTCFQVSAGSRLSGSQPSGNTTGTDVTLCGPGASFNAAQSPGPTTTVQVGQTVSCGRTYSPGPNCQPTAETFAFGDGSQPVFSTQFQGASHTYNQPGVYTVEDIIGSCPSAANATVTVLGSTNQPVGNSGSASITTDKGTYQLGDSIRICYTVPGPGPVTITDSQSGPVLSGVDDGTGGCLSATITPPTGQECEALTYSTNQGSGSTQTCFQVMGGAAPSSKRLQVPFQTQLDAAGSGDDNCGPASLAMVIGSFNNAISLGSAVSAIRGNPPVSGPTDFEGTNALTLLKNYSLKSNTNVHAYADLQKEVAAGHPVIILVNNFQYRYGNPNGQPYESDDGGWFTRDHIVVVTGYDSTNVYVNDPLRSPAYETPPEDYAIPVAVFQNAASNTDSSTAGNWYAMSVGQ